MKPIKASIVQSMARTYAVYLIEGMSEINRNYPVAVLGSAVAGNEYPQLLLEKMRSQFEETFCLYLASKFVIEPDDPVPLCACPHCGQSENDGMGIETWQYVPGERESNSWETCCRNCTAAISGKTKEESREKWNRRIA